jgi:hypothetical protein
VDDDQSVTRPPYVWPDRSTDFVDVRYPQVEWRLYALNEDQLTSLERGASSASLGFLGLTGGIAFSALTTIMTVDLPDRTLAVFWAFLVATTVLSLWFAYQWRRDKKSMDTLTTRIREQHGP